MDGMGNVERYSFVGWLIKINTQREREKEIAITRA